MAAARTQQSIGSQTWFALTFAVAALAVSLVLWSDARADGPAVIEIGETDMVRLSEINAAVLETALEFDLVSRLTSLVAVDVTPARPDGEPLASTNLPGMTPDGWDFGTVRESEAAPVHHASVDARLFPAPRAAGGDAAVSDGLALPATATAREILMGLGGLMMILALIWLITRREERLW